MSGGSGSTLSSPIRLLERLGGNRLLQIVSGRDTKLDLEQVRSRVRSSLGAPAPGGDTEQHELLSWTIAEHPRLESDLGFDGTRYHGGLLADLLGCVESRYAEHAALYQRAVRFDIIDATIAGIEIPLVPLTAGVLEALATPVEVIEFLAKLRLSYTLWRRTRMKDLAMKMVIRDALSFFPVLGDTLDLAPATKNLVGRAIRREAVAHWDWMRQSQVMDDQGSVAEDALS